MRYGGSAIIFGAALAVLLVLHYRRAVSGVILFWAAFILTRPLGAVVGNFFDRAGDHGGLAISRPLIVSVLAVLMILALAVLPQRAGNHGTAAA